MMLCLILLFFSASDRAFLKTEASRLDARKLDVFASGTRCCHATWKGKGTMNRETHYFCRNLRSGETRVGGFCPRLEVAPGKKKQSKECTSCAPKYECKDGFAGIVRDLDATSIFARWEGWPIKGSLSAKDLAAKYKKNHWTWVRYKSLFRNVARNAQFDPVAADVMSADDYVHERNRLKALGIVQEDERSRVITQSHVSSICNMSLATLWRVTMFRPLHEAVASGCNIVSDQSSFSDIIVSECFQRCIDYLQSLPGLPEKASNADSCDFDRMSVRPAHIMNTIVGSTQCAGVARDTLWLILDWVIERRCFRWPRPSVLWASSDGPYGQGDSHPSCAVNGRKAILKPNSASCQEGTWCQCPLKGETVEEMKRLGPPGDSIQQLAALSKQAAAMKVAQWMGPLAPAIALGHLFAKAVEKKWADLATNAVAVIAGFLLVNPLHVPVLLAAVPVWMLKGILKEAFKDCSKTVGCWPGQKKKKVHGRTGNCDMEEEARAGGSPAWFLPPPGLQLIRDDERIMVQTLHGGLPNPQYITKQRCALAACSLEDYSSQRVGFDGARVLNCQPLSWSLMTNAQRELFFSTIHASCTGRSKENDLQAVCTGVRRSRVNGLWEALTAR